MKKGRSKIGSFCIWLMLATWTAIISAHAEIPGELITDVNVDLPSRHVQETASKTPEEVTKLNEVVLRAVLSDPEPSALPSHRTQSIKNETVSNLIHSMNNHPVVGRLGSMRYSRECVQIGYCFGRATYAHLSLLKLGVDRNSIMKAWIVGPMKADGPGWQFHVATLVKGPKDGWFVIDNYDNTLGKAKDLRTWFSQFTRPNPTSKLRLYLTDPSKFTASLGTYDRVQLGLDLTPEQDWYRHYFADLMEWFSRHEEAMAYFSKFGNLANQRPRKPAECLQHAARGLL